MMELLSSDARMTRRLSQNGLHAMAYPTTVNDVYWKQLCDARWAALVVRKPRPLTDAIRKALFTCTQGMTWALPIILAKAQFEAIMSEEEYIDDELIYQVFEERATEMHDLVRAMKDRDSSLLKTYEDLYHPAFDAARADQRRQEFKRLGLLKDICTAEAAAKHPLKAETIHPEPNVPTARKRKNKAHRSRRRHFKAVERKKAG